MKINSAHGGGGRQTSELIASIFQRCLSNDILDRMEDAAVVEMPAGKLALTTDSFVVTPLIFPGGDIGKLSVCGTVNDLLMRGAVPKYLTAGFILEEGLETDELEKIVRSMAGAAAEAGVLIVAGDTKVVEGRGGMMINTAGVGVVETALDISVANTRPGDAVLVSGPLGNHQAALLSSRLGIENTIQSDCAPLGDIVTRLLKGGFDVHTLRDVTRGGLATVLNEIAEGSGVRVELSGGEPFADGTVEAFCTILGLDPLYMANEGKLAVTLPREQAGEALNCIRNSKYGGGARIVGTVSEGKPAVTIKTRSGSARLVDPLLGEGLPRIC